MKGRLFSLLGVKSSLDIKSASKSMGISINILRYYNDNHILPSIDHLKVMATFLNTSELHIKLALGFIDQNILDAISSKSKDIALILGENSGKEVAISNIKPTFNTDLGVLYNDDCLNVLKNIDSDTVDIVFADPPFNLNKLYPSMIDDNLKHHEYVSWCQNWIYECVRVLKNGGSFFLWNLPKWNTILSVYLNQLLTFRHWIGVDIKYSLPIAGRLYPSHYSLLYYCKGEKPNTFKPDRLPMPICPYCFNDLVDYGGYKDKMNPLGVNLCDVWNDIPPVRHAKYKKRTGANELSIKLLDRVIEMSSCEGDVVFDPFGGSGTTYAVAELKRRRWIGVEIGPCEGIVERMMSVEDERQHLDKLRAKINSLMDENIQKERVKRGLWTPSTLKKSNKHEKGQLSLV